MNNPPRRALSALLLSALFPLAATAQQEAPSSCSSDGQPRPVALLERFVNADCDACWSDPDTVRPRAGELALDWIVPGGRGDDAPLSAAASREALARLEATGTPIPPRAGSSRHRLERAQGSLRVAHGLAFRGYIGTSIELEGGDAGPWKAWLLLVEAVPAGSEGTPVARNLVRNALQTTWAGAAPPSAGEQARRFESRPMSIPEGATASRLRVVGWLEDARGRIRAIAESSCVPAGRKG